MNGGEMCQLVYLYLNELIPNNCIKDLVFDDRTTPPSYPFDTFSLGKPPGAKKV